MLISIHTPPEDSGWPGKCVANGYTLSPPFFWYVIYTETGFDICLRKVYGGNFKEEYVSHCALNHQKSMKTSKKIPLTPQRVLRVENTYLTTDVIMTILTIYFGVVFI